jgi:hypothetical protein
MRLKTESYRSHAFRPLSLYREELEEVLEFVKNTCATVEVSDEKRVYDSLEEMEGRVGKKLRYLSITGRKPSVYVELGAPKSQYGWRHDHNRIFVWEPETTETLFFKARDLLRSRQRILSYIVNWPVFAFVSTSLIYVGAYGLGDTRFFPAHRIVEKAVLIFSCASLLLLMYLWRGRSYLSLEYRSKRQSFLERNGDKIWMLIIGAIIGIAGTIAARVLAGLVGK